MPVDKILTPAERRQRNRQEVIANALQVARELIRENGVSALSFNEIARRLGMKPPSLYAYFPSKMAVYDALFRLGMEIFGNRMQESRARGGTVADQLRGSIATYMGFATENPDLYQLLFERPIPGFQPSEESMAVSSATLSEARESFGQFLQDSDLAIDVPLETAYDLAIAIMHGLTAQHMANNPDLPVGEGRYGSLVEYGAQMFLKAWPIKE